MITTSRVVAVSIAIGVALAFVSASAFTTASLDRDVTVEVTDDTAGLVELTPGATEAAFTDDDGALAIALHPGEEGAGAVNPEATFTFGDAEAIMESDQDAETIRDDHDELYLFALAVPDGIQGDDDLQLRTDSAFGSEVSFTVVQAGADAETGTLEGDSDELVLDIDPDEVYFVVMEIGDTQTEGDELGGTLTVETTDS